MIPVLLFPNFDPVASRSGRWHSLVCAGLYRGPRAELAADALPGSAAPEVATTMQVDDFVSWATLGVVLGGRLGYCCFISRVYLPIRGILAVWEGGMSFHGGMLGVPSRSCCSAAGTLSRCWVLPTGSPSARRSGSASAGSRISSTANCGDAGARLAALGDDFPHRRTRAASSEPDLSGADGRVAAVPVDVRVVAARELRARFGLLTGVFLIGYALARIIGELFREPDEFLGFLAVGATMGQLLCIPMLLAGALADPAHAVMERLDHFMARANAAYYATHDPFRDFTTSPEISQVFGEILGLWAAVAWEQIGRPDPVLLVEAGPGRGTLMADALRAMRAWRRRSMRRFGCI